MLLPAAQMLVGLQSLPLLHPARGIDTTVCDARFDHGQNNYREVRLGYDQIQIDPLHREYHLKLPHYQNFPGD